MNCSLIFPECIFFRQPFFSLKKGPQNFFLFSHFLTKLCDLLQQKQIVKGILVVVVERLFTMDFAEMI